MSDLAAAQFNLGNFEEPLRDFEGALEAATAPADRASAHSRLSDHYKLRGQLGRAIEHKQLEWVEREKSHPASVVFTDSKLPSLGLFAMAGEQQRAFEILRRAEDELSVPFTRTIPLGYLNVYLELEDADNAERALAEVEAWIEAQQAEYRRDFVLNAQGRIREMRGAYEEALGSYRRSLELAPTNTYTKRRIARCYRELGRLDEAEAYLKEHLVTTPNNPHAHHELALVYADMGDRVQALQHLRIALEVWSDADPTFKPAQEARASLSDLGPA
jgi:tetratricopeptide (TPR) repeat protein